MVSPLTKGIIILLCINLFLFFGAGIRLVDDGGNGFMDRFIDTDVYDSSGQVVLTEDGIKSTVNDDFQKSGTELLSFIDTLGAIKSFITFLVNIIFTPIGLFTAAAIPASVGLIVGVPFITLLIMGVAYFIRSGN